MPSPQSLCLEEGIGICHRLKPDLGWLIHEPSRSRFLTIVTVNARSA
jgi:hypothetical protein